MKHGDVIQRQGVKYRCAEDRKEYLLNGAWNGNECSECCFERDEFDRCQVSEDKRFECGSNLHFELVKPRIAK